MNMQLIKPKLSISFFPADPISAILPHRENRPHDRHFNTDGLNECENNINQLKNKQEES
jgi:hypothetical protein